MEAVAALEQAADLALLQIGDGLGEQVGPTVQRTHAHDAALQRFGTVRIGGGQAGEVVAALDARQQVFGLLAQRGQLLRRRAFRHPHQDLGHGIEHRAGRRGGLLGRGFRLRLRLGLLRRGREGRIATLVLQEGVDLGIGNDDGGIHRALAQAVRPDLVHQRLAVAVPGDAGFLDFSAQLRHADLVAAGDRGDGLIDLSVSDADAEPIGFMTLHAFHDQALQHLVLQGLVVGHLDAAGLQFAGDAQGSVTQFAQGDHVLVDHGGDAVDELLSGRGRRAFLCRGRVPGALAIRLRRMRGGKGGANGQQQRIAGEAAQRVQPTHHSYLSNVVPVGTGGVMRE